MGDSVILTGGYWSYTKVTELRMDGSYTELPELNQGRHIHGCASYVDEHGNKVTLVTFIEATRYSYLKGLVGCWGIFVRSSFFHRNPDDSDIPMEDCVTISSCIVLCQCQNYQQHGVSCRLKVYHYNLVCFNQISLCSGGQNGYPYTPFAKFYIFENNNWVEIGSFETPRRFNGLSVVDGTDVCRDSGQRQLHNNTELDCIFSFQVQ